MDRVHPELLGLGCPLFADEFVGRQTLEALESATKVARSLQRLFYPGRIEQ